MQVHIGVQQVTWWRYATSPIHAAPYELLSTQCCYENGDQAARRRAEWTFIAINIASASKQKENEIVGIWNMPSLFPHTTNPDI